jgi:Domain of unknown function (DUF4166)
MAGVDAIGRARHWVFRFHLGDVSVRGIGSFEVHRAPTRVAWLLCGLLRVPRSGTGVPVRVAILRRADWEVWMRVIGGRHYVSRQLRRAGRVLERMGPLELEFVVAMDGDGIRYDQTNAALRLGALRVAIPRVAAPSVRARADARDERRFFVRVDVDGPRAFPLFSYWGLIEEA